MQAQAPSLVKTVKVFVDLVDVKEVLEDRESLVGDLDDVERGEGTGDVAFWIGIRGGDVCPDLASSLALELVTLGRIKCLVL